MLSLERTRRRAPLIVALLLVLIALTAVGFACACMSDHPMQGIERTLAATSAAVSIMAPAVFELWAVALVSIVLASFAASQRNGFGRASPQVLQRFRF